MTSHQRTDTTMRRAAVHRRTVVRTSAWATPAVVVAATAPAYATSVGLPARLSFNTFNLYGAAYSGATPTTLESQVSVQNVFYAPWPDTSATLASVTVRVAYPAAMLSGAPAVAVSGTSWTASAPTLSAGQWVYTFTYAAALAPGGSTSTLTFQVPLAGTGPVTATATALGSPATSDTRTASTVV